jgi:hypothetical protein
MAAVWISVTEEGMRGRNTCCRAADTQQPAEKETSVPHGYLRMMYDGGPGLSRLPEHQHTGWLAAHDEQRMGGQQHCFGY